MRDLNLQRLRRYWHRNPKAAFARQLEDMLSLEICGGSCESRIRPRNRSGTGQRLERKQG